MIYFLKSPSRWLAPPLMGIFCSAAASATLSLHPAALHTQADFDRMRTQVQLGTEPWHNGWRRLLANRHSCLDWKPHAVKVVYRGRDAAGHAENYNLLFNDAAAAYALALRWKISGEDAYAEKAIAVLNAWAGTLTEISGSSDRFLASGIYGYQMANAAEILRGYKKWAQPDFLRFKAMMLIVFYPMNHDFLMRHNGAKIDHYWANWDLANMSSMMAIGILTGRRDIYLEAVDYFKHGKGNGAINQLVWKIYPNGLGQLQESGRDQGHSMLNVALAGAFCQMAWNQGDDLFGYADNRLLRGVEYVAKYNLGEDVPYTRYQNSDVSQMVISSVARGLERPVWELFYQHYVVLKRQKAPYTERFARKLRPEGGGGDYGPNSGGYDQLGYGTLTYSLK